MTQSRLTLLLVGGGLLLLTPLLSRYLQADNSIFSVMSTLTEVRENLEEKRLRLQELVKAMGRDRDPAEIARKAEEHHRSGKEIHDLSLNFISVAHTKFPRYSAFLANVRERVVVTYRDIDHLARVAEGKAPMPIAAPAELASATTRPAPRTERASEQVHGTVVAGDVAPPDTSGPSLPVVRPGATTPSGVPAGAILAEPTAARVPSDIIVVEKPKAVASLVPAAPPAKQKAAALAPAPSPNEALRERYKTAYQHFVRGSPDALAEAKHGFSELLRDEPNYYLARYWLVKTHIQLGETDAAKRQAQALIKSQPQLQTARDLARQLNLPLPDPVAPGAQGVPQELASTGSAITPLPGEAQTGAAVGASLSLENPVAVLVEWRVGAGLPSGLSRAALIHELPDARDDSRLVAIFKTLGDKPPRVGPLAAADPGLLSLARTYGAVAAVHAGKSAVKGAPDGLALIDAKRAPAAFVKDELRPAPYNQLVHLLTAAVEAAVPVTSPPAALGAFPRQESATVTAAPAPRLAITRGGRRIEFRYEERTGNYIRQTAEGKDALDSGDRAPFAVANLIVQKGAPTATGTTVIVHRGGQILEARLTRDPEAPLVNTRGRPILLNPGPIWVLGERLPAVPATEPPPMANVDGWSAPVPPAAAAGARIAATAPSATPSPAPITAGSTLAAAKRLSATSSKPAPKPAVRKPVPADEDDPEVQVATAQDAGLPPEIAAEGDLVASDATLPSALARPAASDASLAATAVGTRKAKSTRPEAVFDGAAGPAKAAPRKGADDPGWADEPAIEDAPAQGAASGGAKSLLGTAGHAAASDGAAARPAGSMSRGALGIDQKPAGAPPGDDASPDAATTRGPSAGAKPGTTATAPGTAARSAGAKPGTPAARGGATSGSDAAATPAARGGATSGSDAAATPAARGGATSGSDAGAKPGTPAARGGAATGPDAGAKPGTSASARGAAHGGPTAPAGKASSRGRAARPDPDLAADPEGEDLDAALALGTSSKAAPQPEPAATGGRGAAIAALARARLGAKPADVAAPPRIGRAGAHVGGSIRPEGAAPAEDGEAPLGSETVARLARSRLEAARLALKSKSSGVAGAARATIASTAEREKAKAAALAAKAKRAAEDKAAVIAGDGGPGPVDEDATYDSDPSGIKIRTSPGTLASAPRTAPQAGLPEDRTAAPPARKPTSPRPPPRRIAPVAADEE